MEYNLLDITQNPLTATYLRDIYVLTNGNSEHIYGCVPNGEIGISIILSGQSFIQTNGEWQAQPCVSIYGLVQKVQFHRMSPGYKEINLGFRPEYLQLFLKERVRNLLKRMATDLNFLLPINEVQRLYTQLATAKNDSDIVKGVGDFLARNMRSEKIDNRIAFSLDQIRSGKSTNVADLCSDMKISTTTLRNLYQHNVGISPKDLIKIHRVKSALLRRGISEYNMTETAYTLGYYDQAHFIHEFKDAVGSAPKQYFGNEQLTFDFYNFQRWSYDSFAGIKTE